MSKYYFEFKVKRVEMEHRIQEEKTTILKNINNPLNRILFTVFI